MLKRSGRILFFSRGKGRGHAVPDNAMAGDLMRLQPNLEITFVSYSVGAATLRALGWDVIDLDLPEDPPLWDIVGRITTILRSRRPDLVVSHEEFSVVPMAKAFGLRVVFMTDWFADANWPAMQALRHADEVIFMDEPGFWDVPHYLLERVHYVGCVLRRLEKSDPVQTRRNLEIRRDAMVVLVAPGGSAMHSEARAPVFDLIVRAFEMMDVGEKKLIYVAPEADYQTHIERVAGRADVLIIKPSGSFTATMVASDLVITTGNRTPILESQALGIPSISISSGHNPIDDQRNCRVPTNTPLRAKGLSPYFLRDYMSAALKAGQSMTPQPDTKLSQGRLAAAERIQLHLDRLGDPPPSQVD